MPLTLSSSAALALFTSTAAKQAAAYNMATARLLAIDRQTDAAIAMLKTLPPNPERQIRLGQINAAAGRFKEAADWSRKSIADPFYGAGRSRYVQSYMVLAMSLFRMDRREDAQAALAKGIQIEQAQRGLGETARHGEESLPLIDADKR